MKFNGIGSYLVDDVPVPGTTVLAKERQPAQSVVGRRERKRSATAAAKESTTHSTGSGTRAYDFQECNEKLNDANGGEDEDENSDGSFEDRKRARFATTET